MTELIAPDLLTAELQLAETPAELMRVLDMAAALGQHGAKVRRSALAGGLRQAAAEAYRAEITAAFARLEVIIRAAGMLPSQGARTDLLPGVTSSDFGISRKTAAAWKQQGEAVAQVDLEEQREEWHAQADYDPARWDDPTITEIIRRATSGPDDEWYTPAWLFDALGLHFAVDVCAPVDRTHCSVPADRFYTEEDDGLAHGWEGLAWCNPPYSNPTPWAERMIEHGNGVLLSHVPINGLWSLRAWNRCDVLRLLQGMEFVRPNGELQRPAYWLHLVAFGPTAGQALLTLDDRLNDDVRERFRPSVALLPAAS